MHEIAIAMPVYNEEDGLPETLSELSKLSKLLNISLSLYVQDDCSSDNSLAILNAYSRDTLQIDVETNHDRLGHGGTVYRAYQRAIASGPDCVLQLDGDGQFAIDDVALIIVSILFGSEMTIGQRIDRKSPIFRRVASRGLQLLGILVFGVSSKDLNSPVRGFDTSCLSKILALIPAKCLIPNVYLTVLGTRLFEKNVNLEVEDRVRRGDMSIGSTWRNKKSRNIFHLHFFRFSLRAFTEMLSLRRIRKIKSLD
jgi:glycosyltransferase involved in cell wall biosynthesis